MPTHITGFSGSGLDIESMIQAVLEVERTPIYRLDNEIALAENKLASWGKVETSMSALQGKVQSLTSYSTWQQIAAESSDEQVAVLLADGGASEGRYDVQVTHLAASHRIRSDPQTDIASPLNLAGTFRLGGVDITVGSEDSLATVRDAINTAAATMADEERVRATIVDTTLVIEREQTGSTGIRIDGDGDGVLQALGIVDASLTPLRELQAGRDLSASVNGIEISRSGNTGLTDVIQGTTLNLFREGEATITVARDTASIRTLIEEFVDAYNEAMSTIEAQSSFDVESQTASGALQGDSALRSIQSTMRRLATASDDGALEPDFNSLRKIGIWTTGESNRLDIVDGDRLDDALDNHFDEVEALFRDFDGGRLKEMDRYLDTQTRALDGAIANRQSTLQDQIETNWDRIQDIERRLEDYEENLWIKYAAMDQAIGQMNQQMEYVTNLLRSSSAKK